MKITGELVLPNTPTVTGYPSYNPCNVATTVTKEGKVWDYFND